MMEVMLRGTAGYTVRAMSSGSMKGTPNGGTPWHHAKFGMLWRCHQDAQPLREKQKAWLEKNLDAKKSLGPGMGQSVSKCVQILE